MKKTKTILLSLLIVALGCALAVIVLSSVALSGDSIASGVIAATPVFTLVAESIDPLILWVVVISSAVVVIAAIIIVIVVICSKRKKRRAMADSTVVVATEGVRSEVTTTENAPIEPTAENEEAFNDFIDSIPDETKEAEQVVHAPDTNRKLLASFIRAVNVKADEYKKCRERMAQYISKRGNYKAKASEVQNKLFEAKEIEVVSRASAVLGKIYKIIAKYDSAIDVCRNAKARLLSEFKAKLDDCNDYIGDNDIKLDVVTEVEDSVLYDMAMEKKKAELGATEVDNSQVIEAKKTECADLEERINDLRLALEVETDENRKLDIALELLTTEQRMEECRDEIGNLIGGNSASDDLSESLNETLKNEIISGNGLVTKEQKKLRWRDQG